MTVTDENLRDEGLTGSSGWQWQDAFEPIPRIFGWYKDHAAAGTVILAAFLVLKGYVIARETWPLRWASYSTPGWPAP